MGFASRWHFSRPLRTPETKGPRATRGACVVLEELVDGGEVGLHTGCSHRTPFAEPGDIAGYVHGGDVEGGDGVEFTKLEEAVQVGSVVL